MSQVQKMFDNIEEILTEYLSSDFTTEARKKFYKRVRQKSKKWLKYCVVYGIAMVMDKQKESNK